MGQNNRDKKKVIHFWAQKRRLKGKPYETLVESLFDEIEEVPDSVKNARRGPDYNLTSFLMKDLERIARIEELFVNGIDQYIEFDHLPALIAKQELINEKTRIELLNLFFKENLTFLDNLKSLYDEVF